MYHCISRTVNGERILGSDDKEFLAYEMAVVAEFCGISVLTYTLMDNHFHALVRVPRAGQIDDRELVRRYRLLHRKPSPMAAAGLFAAEEYLSLHGVLPPEWKDRQLRLMNDVSHFMRLLKQRFSIGFNKTHNRYGTLWSERFKSLLVEPDSESLRAVAMYIDLNAVRAGMVTDPKDYAFCGYGAAVAGSGLSRRGILSLMGLRNWDEAQAGYRIGLFAAGAKDKEHAGAISPEDLHRVLREAGRLPLGEALRARRDEFANGLVLGGEEYVRSKMQQFRPKSRNGRQAGPHRLAHFAESLDVLVLRRSRVRRK